MRLAFWIIFLTWMIYPLPLWAQTPSAELNFSKRYEQAQDLLHDGKTDEAIRLGRETVALAKSRSSPENITLLTTTENELAQLYLRCNNFPEAEKLLTALLQQSEQAYGPNDLRVAQALYDLGWFYSNLSHFPQAHALFQRALTIRETILGRRHSQTALLLNSLGVLEENKGAMTSAEKYFLEAIDIQKSTIGLNTATTATTLNNLATLYWSQADYMRAEKLFSQALSIREQVRGRGSLVTATTLNNLALVYLDMGDYERAETLFRRVLFIRGKKLGQSHPLTITTVNHLGLLYYDLGDYAQSEALLQRSVQTREKTLGLDSPDTARSLFHLACLYDKMEVYDKAGPLHHQALAIRERILGLSHPETAASYAFLARHEHLMGETENAAAHYQKAITLQKANPRPFHPELLKTLENFAYLQLDQKNHAYALTLAQQTVDLREQLLQRVFSFTNEKRRMDFQKTLNFYNLSGNIGDAALLARVIYRTKGIVLDSVMEEQQALHQTRNPEIENLGQQLNHLSLQNPASINQFDLEHQADQLRATLQEKLHVSSTCQKALSTDPSTIVAAVPEHAVIVEFIRYGDYRGKLAFEPSYGALLQIPHRRALWFPLGAASEIESCVALYQKYLRRRVSETALRQTLQQLYQKIWRPVAAVLPEDCQRVIISTDAALNLVSFATLLNSEGKFLCEQWGVEYVTSARELLKSSPPLSEHNPRLRILAAPDFGKAPAHSSASQMPSLAPLPGTAIEADVLGKLAHEWGFSVETYLGTHATQNVLKMTPPPDILHIATHGCFLDSSFGSKSTSGSMQRSILALTGAQDTLNAWQNGAFTPQENDGILTAEEAATLPLQGTWLVVLSTCDSGLGQSVAGEGVFGLRRGFLMSGAQNLLMTLWPLEDSDTTPFIQAFYREALSQRNPAQALHRVQRDLLLRLSKEKDLWQAVHKAGPFILTY